MILFASFFVAVGVLLDLALVALVIYAVATAEPEDPMEPYTGRKPRNE
jgi:hypothetical protein